MKVYCFCMSFMLCLFPCLAQDKKVQIQGIVIDENNIPITDVFIGINWGKMGLLSQEDGSFYISVSTQDTLIFKHTSFEPKAVVVGNLPTNDTLKIQLTERTLELGEVYVTNWGNWEDFKHKIATMNADSIRQTGEYRLETMFGGHIDHPIKNPYFRGQEEPKLNPLTILRGIFSMGLHHMLYNKYSKTEKIRRKIQAQLLQEIAIEENAYRYSEDLIGEILKIEGIELKNFKQYCDYLLDFKQNDHGLLLQIKKLYAKWKQQGKDLKIDTLREEKINYLPVNKTPFKSATSERKR